MCGIVGYIGKKSSISVLIPMLSQLDYRGYDSIGIASATSEKMMQVVKRLGYLGNGVTSDDFLSISGTASIGHVRWATHGKADVINAHPHVDCTGKIAVVHNGIINNFQTLKRRLKDEGHIFNSDTDTEVIPHLIERYSALPFAEAFKLAIDELTGEFAIAAINSNHPDEIMVVRNGMPLLIAEDSEGFYIASDMQAFPSDAAYFIEIPENKIVSITPDSISPNLERLEFRNNNMVADKASYPHFMLKEIYEQPRTFQLALQQPPRLIETIRSILAERKVILTGCGTSYYACQVAQYLGIGQQIVVGSELSHYPFKNEIVLAVSQSGETGDILDGIKGREVISIINKPRSQLERLSSETILMNCGAEIGVAATKSFISQLAIFYLLSNQNWGDLIYVPVLIEQCFNEHDKIKTIAQLLKNTEHIYYLGKGINSALAGECSLKMKEISYIHAEAFRAGELKHGTLSLIESGTPVIGLCPNDEYYQETINNIHEAKARGAYIIGISDCNNTVFDCWIEIPRTFYPVTMAVMGQLLAYETAVAKGLNPDKPRNLAKSVTVR